MAAKRNSKRKKSSAKTDKRISVPNDEIQVEVKTARPRVKAKKRTKPGLDESLGKPFFDGSNAQKEAEKEPEAQIGDDKILLEATENLAASRPEIEQVHQTRIKRLSFVVRLTVDEQDRICRTEIEHVESGRKQNLLSFEGERLAKFMKASIIPRETSKQASLSESTHDDDNNTKTPTEETFRSKPTLIITDVRIFCPKNPNINTLTLTIGEPFVVQVHFQLQGSELPSLEVQNSTYEINLYANEIKSRKSMLLTSSSATLTLDVVEYTSQVNVSGLSPGIYRLFTHITLGQSIRVIGHHDGPIIRVI